MKTLHSASEKTVAASILVTSYISKLQEKNILKFILKVITLFNQIVKISFYNLKENYIVSKTRFRQYFDNISTKKRFCYWP